MAVFASTPILDNKNPVKLKLRNIDEKSPEKKAFNVHANEEIVIYGFIIRMTHDLNLLDFFERFKAYSEANNVRVTDSFSFTVWLMEVERVGFQDASVKTNLGTLRAFWHFQDDFLAKERNTQTA